MALPQANMTVDVVSADRVVWQGEAISVLARTTEGDIGILRNHEPMLAALVPCAAEIVKVDGEKQIIALDGGFISVEMNHVSLISRFAKLVEDIDAPAAEKALATAQAAIADSDHDDVAERELMKAQAEFKAVIKQQGLSH